MKSRSLIRWTLFTLPLLVSCSAEVANTQKAAQHGDPVAQDKLAKMYSQGIGVEQNSEKATEWWIKSAERGNPDAEYHLGIELTTANGFPDHAIRAYMWLSLAAKSGVTQAATDRDKVASVLTPDQIEEGNRRIQHWVDAHHPKG